MDFILDTPHVGILHKKHNHGLKAGTDEHVYTIQVISHKSRKLSGHLKIKPKITGLENINFGASIDIAFGKIPKSVSEDDYIELDKFSNYRREGFRSNFKKYFIHTIEIEVETNSNGDLLPIFMSMTKSADFIHKGEVHYPGTGG